jgi:hypothetical protein
MTPPSIAVLAVLVEGAFKGNQHEFPPSWVDTSLEVSLTNCGKVSQMKQEALIQLKYVNNVHLEYDIGRMPFFFCGL